MRAILLLAVVAQIYYFGFATESPPRGIARWNPELAESSAKAFLTWKNEPTKENEARWKAEEAKVQWFKTRRILALGTVLVLANSTVFLALWNIKTRSSSVEKMGNLDSKGANAWGRYKGLALLQAIIVGMFALMPHAEVIAGILFGVYLAFDIGLVLIIRHRKLALSRYVHIGLYFVQLFFVALVLVGLWIRSVLAGLES